MKLAEQMHLVSVADLHEYLVAADNAHGSYSS